MYEVSISSNIQVLARYFKRVLISFASAPFYPSQVKFPMTNTPISPIITNNPQFHFFCSYIGAVDGTHIRIFAAADDQPYMHNRKGFLSQNCLFVCDFDFFFTYALSGGDRSAADGTLWNDAHIQDLWIPATNIY